MCHLRPSDIADLTPAQLLSAAQLADSFFEKK